MSGGREEAATSEPQPFLRPVAAPAPRERAEELPALVPAPAPGLRTGRLIAGGAGLLVAGIAVLGAVGFVMDQFARAAWLGWLSSAILAGGFVLLGTGLVREMRALWALDHVDALRADFTSGDAGRIMRAASDWARRAGADAAVQAALRAVNDPDAAVALLRAGPGRALRDAADARARAAAVQVVAGIAAVPSPALDVLFVAWRGVRLVRETAVLYGVRPGLLGTLALLRRTALSASLVGAAELAGNALAHGLLASPLIGKLVGEAAGAGLAARRMVVLGRAAASACDPLPPP